MDCQGIVYDATGPQGFGFRALRVERVAGFWGPASPIPLSKEYSVNYRGLKYYDLRYIPWLSGGERVWGWGFELERLEVMCRILAPREPSTSY